MVNGYGLTLTILFVWFAFEWIMFMLHLDIDYSFFVWLWFDIDHIYIISYLINLIPETVSLSNTKQQNHTNFQLEIFHLWSFIIEPVSKYTSTKWLNHYLHPSSTWTISKYTA